MKRVLKKVLAGLLITVMCFGFTACGETPAVDEQPPATETDGGSEAVSPDVAADDEEIIVNEDDREGDELNVGTGLVEDFQIEETMDENPDQPISRGPDPILQNVVTALDGSLVDGSIYFYRDLLSDNNKQAYDVIRAGLVKGKKEIAMCVPIKKNDLKEIYLAVFYDSPDIFWMNGGYGFSYNGEGNVTKVSPKYNNLVNDLKANQAKFESAVEEALADMWSLKTDVKKVKYAHDYLTSTVKYNLKAANNQSAFSAIVNKKSVCAGYSRAFQYMMQKMNIPCAYITGTASSKSGSENHAWNLIKLEGQFYSMDVTWDDPVGGKEGKFYYDYFNLTDNTMSKDHQRSSLSAALPKAKGKAMSFASAFGKDKKGTNFNAIKGTLPDGYGEARTGFIGGEGGDVSDNPYLN